MGQLIGIRVQVLLSFSWVLRALFLCVTVMKLFGGTEKKWVTVNLGSQPDDGPHIGPKHVVVVNPYIINPSALELDIYSLAHHLCKM